MKKFLKNQKGVTMIEVLVTIALLAVVVTPCLSAFVMAQRGNVKAAETQSAYTAAANLMEELKGLTSFKSVFPEIEDGDPDKTYKKYYEQENITLFVNQNMERKQYYIVTIYQGNWTEDGVALPTEYLLKGVVTP